jgi:RHS repeat-associated protein
MPLGLARSTTWDCTGGVALSNTDENGKVTSTSYSDPYFWRPASTTDALGNVTTFTYSGANSVSTNFTFNGGNSVVGTLTTVDGLGRPILRQTPQGPAAGTYDSIETDYDNVGHVLKQSLPFSAAAGALCTGTCPGTTFAYDGLGRITSVTDNGGLSATFTYVKNDVYKNVGPAPTGENRKRKQFEYDSIGRLTSVCEITSATGSGSCAQTSPQTGFWTKYVYEPLGNITSVTQNAQSASTQTRTFAFDLMGRMTSETNPESGASSYFYDTVATGLCAGTYAGDLNKSSDAVGNTVCYTYDALHRPTSSTYNGPYAASTPNKYFIYDSATVNSIPMTNTSARLAEAYTSTCQTGCTKSTDLGISYSARGEPTDTYEKTSSSGTYYHVTAGYWEHGLLKQISNVPGLTTITYGVDAEGRPATVSAASGQLPVTNSTYNVASLPTEVDFGSLDKDIFSYDPNSFRLTEYKFNVNGQNVIGDLTWNANSTLGVLNITDPFDAANAQNCTYARDDLGRLTSANCGAAWLQTFSFDVFGNISKAGSGSFQATYSTSNTNRIASLPGFTPTYDANGNIQTDSFHTYAWNADGSPVSVDTVNLTYDALGRVVEQNRSGAVSQVLYMPSGEKLALMSGQTLQKAFIALPGGATAVYGAGGLSYYRHGDWEGSSRFASTTARAKYFDVAYAPYGEDYADSGTSDLDFTGQNQDTVAGDYDFVLREYSEAQGRWVSPDPLGLAAVDPANPQSWNRYGYVENDPLDRVDPSGGCGDDIISDIWNGVDPGCGGSGFGFQGPSPACGTVSSGYGCVGWGEYGGMGSSFSASLWISTGVGSPIWGEDPGIPMIYPTIWDLLRPPHCVQGFLPGCAPGGTPALSFTDAADAATLGSGCLIAEPCAVGAVAVAGAALNVYVLWKVQTWVAYGVEDAVIRSAIRTAAKSCGRTLSPEEEREVRRSLHDELEWHKRGGMNTIPWSEIVRIAKQLVCG